MSFKDQVVVVTGAGAGIGKAVALLFAQRGARVVVSDHQAASGQAVVTEITDQGGQGIFIAADVADHTAVDKLVQETVATYGRLDVWVNNAGIGPRHLALTADTTLEDWDRVIAVNQSGVYYGMKVALRQMTEQGQGCIVNVASLAGLKASMHTISYAASKFAVVGMTKVAALEYARYGVRVNAVCPGFTHTDLFDRLLATDERMEERLRRQIPQRRFGKVTEIAEAIAYLASAEAGFLTGQALVLDGGMSL